MCHVCQCVPVKMKEPEHEVSCSISEPRQLRVRELLEASYAEMSSAKREPHIEKINGFKSKNDLTY